MLTLKIERLTKTAKLPIRAHSSDAGLDLFADEDLNLAPGEFKYVRTGLRLAIDEGYVGLVWDKSGVAGKGLHTMAGVIDAGYRGEVQINMINLSSVSHSIKNGQKIAQLLIQKIETPKIIEGELDDETSRGADGFGSTGLH